MAIYISGAPSSWGVDDPKNPNLPDWQLVVHEAHQAGFTGMELGPYTYMPTKKSELMPMLEKNQITIMTGTIFEDLVSEEHFPSIVQETHDICQLVSQLPQKSKQSRQHYPTPYLTIMDFSDNDAAHLARDYNAGHPDRAQRLDKNNWNIMMQHIKEISKIAAEYGVRPVVHPHAGGFIEFEDEIAQLIQDIPYDLTGLCLDVGHLYYSKMDPEKTLIKYWDRVDYIHFKDIDKNKYQEVMSKKIKFFDACADQVMCPIGQGCIDYKRLHVLLADELKYEGFITVEQERDPRNSKSSLQDVKQSVDYLKSIGFKQ
ncbi:sugar phosphate isomerase/epimerase family protein [Bombilactobacillus bombi]|uniref:AP endonuclease n=1 Tax=Bombilactobacillus bombi TaxID=1303590 RepID=A0A3R6UZ45_9LACO|nr:sugar phosphate isomerase/epimerase [Bombilactobacillus bombi]RHW51210.1 AP endonuclease [Bombilactobacillus bombi]